MKWAVIVFPGSNCDEDAAAAVRCVTGDTVHLIWHTTDDVSAYDAIILPGGFSYGDYLRSGAIARFSPVMQSVVAGAAAGKPVLGICNGFQVLAETGLLPGGLLRNNHLQFRCDMVTLTVRNNRTPFTAGYRIGETIRIPIAHGDGRYYADEDMLRNLQDNHQIAFTYEENPNGSSIDIAGVLNRRGNVLGMMPHPERAVADWMRSADGTRLFQSIHQHVEEALYAH